MNNCLILYKYKISNQLFSNKKAMVNPRCIILQSYQKPNRPHQRRNCIILTTTHTIGLNLQENLAHRRSAFIVKMRLVRNLQYKFQIHIKE